MTHFALIGAAGYIAPRHMIAIKKGGGDLVVDTRNACSRAGVTSGNVFKA